MIKKITVKNFQSLREVEVEPGQFTLILGESDLGKSAFIRAIYAAATNQTGQEFISYGESATTVDIDTEGDEIVWEKGKSATYEVWEAGARDPEGSGEFLFRPNVFEKARGVPDQVAESLRLGSIECGDTSIEPAFHTQFSGPFLVTDTPSVRAKVIGELSGINLLFLATQEARRFEGQARRLEGQRLSDLEKQKALLEGYEGLDELSRLLDAVLTALRSFDEYDAYGQHIGLMLTAMRDYAAKLRRLMFRKQVLSETLERLDALPKPGEAETQPGRDGAAIRLSAAALRAKMTHAESLRVSLAELDSQLAAVTRCPTCGRLM